MKYCEIIKEGGLIELIVISNTIAIIIIFIIVPKPGFCLRKNHKDKTAMLIKKVATPIEISAMIETPSAKTVRTVLAEGVSIIADISIGVATFFISIAVLSLWFFLKQKPGLGTIMNIIIIAIVLDITISSINPPSLIISQYFTAVLGVFLVGLGSGFYLTANLGPGPRDGLMTGLTKRTNLPIALVRGCIEVSAVAVGWYLGGNVGIGTLIYAFGIGPCVALGLFIVDKVFN